MNEEIQPSEESSEVEGGKNLRSIERSNLRGAQKRTSTKKRQPVKTVRRRSVSKQGTQGQARRKKKSGAGKKAAIFFTLVAIITLFLLTTVFATATLDLTLATAEVSVDGVFQAVREPAQSKDITYLRLGVFEATQKAPIEEGTWELQNARATGTVMLYNTNPSGESLDPLINRTRLQSESGKMYRLIGTHVIPGGKTVNGKFVPGSKEVKIEADNFGDDYDLPNKGTRLSIPGLAKYKGFANSYALTTEKIVGGSSGEILIPDPAEEAKIREHLRRNIEKEVRDKLAKSVNNSTSERVVFEEGIFIEFTSLKRKDEGCEEQMICEKGELYAISFRETELAALLAKYTSSPVQTVPPARIEAKNLSMSIEKSDEFEIVSSTEFSFRLSGTAKLSWDIDTALLTSDIKRKNRKEVADILTNEYPQVIQHKTPSIFPAWRNTLPANEKKIEVTVRYSE